MQSKASLRAKEHQKKSVIIGRNPWSKEGAPQITQITTDKKQKKWSILSPKNSTKICANLWLKKRMHHRLLRLTQINN
jgi:hypothetical protein